MRIAYLAHINHGRASGVVAKIRGQLDQWRKHGNDVRIFIVTRDRDVAWTLELGDVRVERYDSYASRMRALWELIGSLRAASPDLVYLRWDLFHPPYLRLPSALPIVAEVNANDLTEYALDGRLRALYNRTTRGIQLRRADALVFVARELSDHPGFRVFPGRHAVIGNGIDLDAYPELPAPPPGPPRLVFVGGGLAPWHGVEKVLDLAARRPAWQFDVVGQGAGETAAASGGGSLPANVRRHGSLERAALLEVLGAADVGIGSLSLYRAGLQEGSPLKLREYLAVGLPVVYGHLDADVDQLDDLALRIPNTPTNVVDSLSAIDAFVEGARGRRVPRAAIEHIGTAAKERLRLDLFDELVSRRRPGT